MTYLAKLRRLTDFEKTLGRLYMTVLDFSLLQRVTADALVGVSAVGFEYNSFVVLTIFGIRQ